MMNQRDRRVLYAILGLVAIIVLVLVVTRPAEARPAGSLRSFLVLFGVALLVWAAARRR